MSNFYDFEWATDTLSSARSEQAGKPLENNTRLFRRSDDTFAVKLHAVDVVTINRDGTYTLRNGGWNTVTTMQRIRNYAPVNGTLFSERGDWYVRMTPDANDAQPARVDRTVPKPFHSTDPGPEPVKNDEGCVAGQLVTTEHIGETVEVWRKDMQDGDEFIEVATESGMGNSDYDRVKVKRSWNSHVYIGESAHAYQDEGWFDLDDNHSRHNSRFTNDDGENVEYVQCSHCKDFDTVHENWRYRMHGERYSRRFDEPGGYSVYAKMIDMYGTPEAWREAYLTDLHERKAYLKADREWDQRNRVPFYDGIIVDSHGYAQRKRKSGPSKTKLDRHERKVAKIKNSIDKYVDGFIAAMKAGEVRMPGSGDCWYCLLRTQDGQTMGDSMTTLHEDGSLSQEVSNGHLFDHIEENYYVPSLAVNALRERGYRDVGIYIHLGMDQDTGMMGGPGAFYDSIKRDLTKYMRKRMVPSAPTK